jgi:flagellar biogenesis protein FliO
MRICKTPRLAVLIALALAPAVARTQQPGSLISPHVTPITVDQPPTFPAAAAHDARPLNPSFSVAPRPPQSPVNTRLTSGEEPISNSKARPTLKLAPRSETSHQHGKKPSAPTPSSALTTVAGSLALVLGLFLVIAWCTRRFSPAGATILPKEAVELLGRTSLAARQQAHLVRIGNKLLLVAISPGGAETLTEITEPTEVEHLTALCRRGQPTSSTVAFRQALSELASEPAQSGFVGVSRSNLRGAR